MAKKQPEKKFKTLVYVFLFESENEPFLGQQVNKQLESENTELWDLISSKFPENYLAKGEYFTLTDGKSVESGKHSFGSKKVLTYTELVDKLTYARNFRINNEKFCSDFVDYFEQDKVAKKTLPKNITLVIQKIAA